MKIISFSLWGNNPKYTHGAIHNVNLQLRLLPDWKCRFYIDETSVPPSITDELSKKAEIINKGKGDWRGMFWRFEAAEDADIMISRDCDSRLSEREVCCLNEWLASDKDFHIIRDHPQHGVPILGGMWGVRNGLLKNIRELLKLWTPQNRWQTDQEFLAKIVYNRVKEQAFVHDEFHHTFGNKMHKIKHERKDGEHIGGVFDANDNPRQQDRDWLR